jgi:hypothetical protein
MKTFSGHRSRQEPGELSAFIDLLKGENVRGYLEIGACHGDTFHTVMSALPKGSKGVAIDLPEADAWGKAGSAAALAAAVSDLNDNGYVARGIFGDSATDGVRDLAMLGGPYEAVFIDGDHRYEGVKADWLAYGPMARIIAFHDIAGEGQITRNGAMHVEVPRLWNELKPDFRHREIIARGSKKGIGVLWR